MADHFGRFSAQGHQPTSLYVNDSLYSYTRAFRLLMQDDGNLVLYAIDGNAIHKYYQELGGTPANLPQAILEAGYPTAVWATGTNGKAVNRCDMQYDGNLVLYSPSNQPVWASGTSTFANEAPYLICQDDGNLVIYVGNGAAVWKTNTQARKP
jgi:hypothetical protein